MNSIQLLLPSALSLRVEAAISAMCSLIAAGHPIALTLSGGKDSGLTTILGLEAVRRTKERGIAQPRHYVTAADTAVENPAMHQHLLRFLEEVRHHCRTYELDVEVHLVRPSLASQFVVSTIGRGTLARTVQNSVKDGKSQRQCSDDWKVRPQQRLRKQLATQATGAGKEIVTILGMRRSESSARASRMDVRGETSEKVIRNEQDELTFSPLADFSTDDVWWALALFKDPTSFPFPSPVSARTITRMHDLYREANDGTCGIVLGESGQRAACGSRFGCSTCLVSGEKDKSMESMIKEPKHAHLAGLSRFRNFLLATQWDLSKREVIGRTVSDAGYVKLQPDTYSFWHRIEMLRYLLTLDVLEAERAEAHSDLFESGLIEDTDENRELCDVQFEMIRPQQLVATDFYLGLDYNCDHAFPALSAWYDVYRLGRRYEIPEIVEPVSKSSIPHFGWYNVGQLNREVPVDGLRSYHDEMWNVYRHRGRGGSYTETTDGERMCYFEEADQFSIDPLDATLAVTCSFESMFSASRFMSGLDSSRFWLNEGIVRLPKGKAALYQQMAKRGQYFDHLMERFNLSPDELIERLKKRSISDAEHNELLRVVSSSGQADDEAEQGVLVF